MLKNNCVPAISTGGSHWMEYLADHMYCFLPSYDSDKGKVQVYEYIPEFVKEFLFCMTIEKVKCKRSIMNYVLIVYVLQGIVLSSVYSEEQQTVHMYPKCPEDKEDMLAVSKVFDIHVYFTNFDIIFTNRVCIP